MSAHPSTHNLCLKLSYLLTTQAPTQWANRHQPRPVPFFIIYLGERVLRVLRASRYTPLRRARLLPGDVLELRLG